MEKEKDKLKSRLGFLLISAGCAIGIGNVWKFPYMVGENGGGIFVLIYILFLLLLGVPALTMEFTLGRMSGKSPVKMYNQLEKPGQKWHLHGWAAVLGNYLLMMFYVVVAGWMLQYFVLEVKDVFNGMDATAVAKVHSDVKADPNGMILYSFLTVISGFFMISFGVQKGLEKVSKVMMTALFIIMIALAVNSFFQPGAEEGLKFYLTPNLGRLNEQGVVNVIVAAMNQAFFTLSIGMGSMAIFGSYIGKDRALLGESVSVAALDFFVAFSSGLIIFPACFAYNVDVAAGPSLIFVTLPNIFNNMPFGRLWGSLFFVFMSFAAYSTVIAVFENIVACTKEMFNWSRKKACIINAVAIMLLVLPCIFGYNLLKDVQILGEGTNIMDFEDFLVSNIILPIGALCYVLFATSKWGVGWKKFEQEANTGKGLKIKKWMKGYVSYVLPVLIFAIFVLGLLNYFKVFE